MQKQEAEDERDFATPEEALEYYDQLSMETIAANAISNRIQSEREASHNRTSRSIAQLQTHSQWLREAMGVGYVSFRRLWVRVPPLLEVLDHHQVGTERDGFGKENRIPIRRHAQALKRATLDVCQQARGGGGEVEELQRVTLLATAADVINSINYRDERSAKNVRQKLTLSASGHAPCEKRAGILLRIEQGPTVD